jgi:hypothetical protein
MSVPAANSSPTKIRTIRRHSDAVNQNILPYLTPISGLMDGDGCEWDARDPLDLLSREEREELLQYLAEYDRHQARARVAAQSYPLH